MYHCLIFTQKVWYYLIIISDKSLQSDLLFASLKGYNDHKLCIHLNVSHWILQPWCLCCKRSRIYVISFWRNTPNVFKCLREVRASDKRQRRHTVTQPLSDGRAEMMDHICQTAVCLSELLFVWLVIRRDDIAPGDDTAGELYNLRQQTSSDVVPQNDAEW